MSSSREDGEDRPGEEGIPVAAPETGDGQEERAATDQLVLRELPRGGFFGSIAVPDILGLRVIDSIDRNRKITPHEVACLGLQEIAAGRKSGSFRFLPERLGFKAQGKQQSKQYDGSWVPDTPR